MCTAIVLRIVSYSSTTLRLTKRITMSVRTLGQFYFLQIIFTRCYVELDTHVEIKSGKRREFTEVA